MKYTADIQKLEPGNQIRLFELDATRLGGNLWRFHGHAQESDIIWQGQLYSPIQITAKGLICAAMGARHPQRCRWPTN